MDWIEALDVVVARTRHERYRELCSILNPDTEQREAYRALMVEQATGQAPLPTPTSQTAPVVVVTGRCCGG